MFEMQQEGKILHVGLSNATRAELEEGLQLGPIATVENMYSYAQRTTVQLPYGANPGGEEVLDLCEQHGIPLIPFFSLIHGLPKAGDKLAAVAKKHNASEAQAQRCLAAAQVALDTADSGHVEAGASARKPASSRHPAERRRHGVSGLGAPAVILFRLYSSFGRPRRKHPFACAGVVTEWQGIGFGSLTAGQTGLAIYRIHEGRQ
ncbi:aldo/keto reductase [Hymenobacter humi]